MPDIDINALGTDDKWFCEQGTCYQSPNGTLTYTQCKASCTQYPCSMFFEMCQDYNMVIAGNHPSFSAGNVSALLDHWVLMYALPQMGGYSFTKPQLFGYIQKCCTPIGGGGGTGHIVREIRENYYDLPAIVNQIGDNDVVLGGVISSQQSAFIITNLPSPYETTRDIPFRNQQPSTYDNSAITPMPDFTPYSND